MKSRPLALLLGLSTILIACQPGGGGTPSSGGTLRIEGWPSGQSGRIEFFLAGSSTPFAQSNVDANGNTTYNLPTPAPNTLAPLNPSVPSGCTGTVNANPTNANTSLFVSILAYLGGSNSPSGTVIAASRAPSSNLGQQQGDKVGLLLYLDRDVSISGNTSCPASGSSPATSTSFNINFKQGWNYLILSTQAASSSSIQQQATASTSLPPDLRWYYSAGISGTSLTTPLWLR
ncbi:MAG: hypothetical protein NZL94_07145 [Meiothermus sp.]|uniref:hypothetical protein n=1 Tax=Meiothermus sp. TaxID=1955249 RepID=UPI00261003B9|nr:hypothetical protein [Meiothermus sp.]MCS7058641.1 hypothetical protein [Meiothermus sp.]MCX7739883.1 hypothetical protein [Meiothermus sp.]MDW8090153.1 hypothetical protein [Meiothermus sp.]MDW8481455.1 hypothetical protein [Meiothermus sp.]